MTLTDLKWAVPVLTMLILSALMLACGPGVRSQPNQPTARPATPQLATPTQEPISSNLDDDLILPKGTGPLTAKDVKFVVYETAIDLHRGGWIGEPRQFHAEEACDLWKEHGTSLPSSHWVDKLNEAEDKKHSRTLPIMVIILTLVRLGEADIVSEGALTEYCDDVLAYSS